MDSRRDARELAELEQAVAAVSRAATEVTELLRALAPVAAGMPALQAALAEFQTAAQRRGDGSTHQPASERTAPQAAGARRAAERPAVATQTEPAANAAAATTAPTTEAVAGPPPQSAETTATDGVHGAAAQPRRVMRRVTVSVSRPDGPLDLVRVHSALDGLAGASGLTLASYTFYRAVLFLDTDLPPEALPLADALRAAFPEGVSGRWVSETEFDAMITARG